MKANRKKRVVGISLILIALFLFTIIGLFTINVTAHPPDNTRMIVEYTERTYIAPPCFGQAETTNNVGEMTLLQSKERNFEPESNCTVEALQGQPQRLIYFLRERMGIGKSNWDW